MNPLGAFEVPCRLPSNAVSIIIEVQRALPSGLISQGYQLKM
jgi:hypothetical protein